MKQQNEQIYLTLILFLADSHNAQGIVTHLPSLCMFVIHKNNKKTDFFIGSERMNWDSARDYCQTEGGELASIHSEEENNAVVHLCHAMSADCWIGFNDLTVEHTFEWTDG